MAVNHETLQVALFDTRRAMYHTFKGWLAHLARHTPLSARVNHAVG